MINLTTPAGALDAATRDQLLEDLAGTLLQWEGAPDTEFFREITWVYANEADVLAVGGRPGGTPRYRVDITVPQGALSERRKAGLVADVHKAVSSAAGLGDEQGLHVWTLINEVPEGNWGAAGHVVQFEMLRNAAQAERDGDGGGNEAVAAAMNGAGEPAGTTV
jgi:phenylpyruvate tautomerase PptA (4-oxalocrotonate tautomerase family)